MALKCIVSNCEDEDVMKIRSDFMKRIISSLISKTLKKKLGKRMRVDVGNLDVKINRQMAHIHIEVNAEMPKDELKELLFEKIGLW